MNANKDIYKTSRILHVIEAMLEYFIALGIGGGYLAKLGLAIGMEKSLIAIIEAFVSLGFGFQIISVFLIKKTPVKPWITVLHIISQIFFALIWFVPTFRASDTAKIVLFVALLLSAQIMHNILYSPKQNWFMSLVDANKRGRFTAIKEIVSLMGGMIFTLLYGKLIDHFTDGGQQTVAFVLCGSLLLAIMLAHTVTLVFSKEKKQAPAPESLKSSLSQLIKDKHFLPIIILPSLYNIIHYSTLPFFAVYQADTSSNGLGFSAFYIGIVATAYSITRAIVSLPIGKLADKRGYPYAMNLSFIIMAVSFLINVFTTPENGHVLYPIAYCLYGASMAGINGGMLNIIFEFFPQSLRTAALALKNTVAGTIGFLTTLLVTPFVDFIASKNNIVFGQLIYAPQILSAVAVVLVLCAILYNKLVVCKLKRAEATLANN